MFLFIFESIGTSELVLIGIVALIFLGPRKMPEMARKIGKMMNEFRSTTNEFKETWQREANFEEEMKAFDINALETEPIARDSDTTTEQVDSANAPAIRELDPAEFEKLKASANETKPVETAEAPTANDKQNWL